MRKETAFGLFKLAFCSSFPHLPEALPQITACAGLLLRLRLEVQNLVI